MIPSPILKALSSIRTHQVQALLMGGQACVFYGAAEFSRDTDFAVLAEPENLVRLRAALDALAAKCIAVPPFQLVYLRKGHAVHFRCEHPDAAGLRIDVMGTMRGVEPFAACWERRTTITDERGTTVELMSLPDLVQAKKTQRDKDWPMVRRLLEAHYFAHRQDPTPERVEFWLLQLRTPELLEEVARTHPEAFQRSRPRRALLDLLPGACGGALERALEEERFLEQEKDRAYWKPLRAELQELRHQVGRRNRE